MQRAIPALSVVGLFALAAPVAAQGDSDASTTVSPGAASATEMKPSVRPAILMNRWQEDWSVLADPMLRTHPLDRLKYLPLSGEGSSSYLSLGGGWRTRFETSDAPAFQADSADGYAITRIEAHADLHVGPVQLFVQLQDDFTTGKRILRPVDSDRLDLEQGFIALVLPAGGGILRLRAGRQQMAFDLQRFVSVRDGPNVRQSFDALWGAYEIGPWRFIGYYTQPVATRDTNVFDDKSSPANRFYGFRVERHVLGDQELSAYWSRYTNDNARFLTVAGVEQRDVWDVRFAGKKGRIDWDAEAMGQTGHVGTQRIRAWAAGVRAGYTFSDKPLQPRLGLQFDAASGDRDPTDGTLGTFNPLFPNGSYLTLASDTGYVNFIHAKAAATVHPSKRLTLTGAVAAQWRLTVQDAVYTQPNIPVPGTAGTGSRWTGSYGQFRADWLISGQLSAAVEAVHFEASDALRAAGGTDSNYLGLQVQFAW